jgi:hypothetical protein
MPSNLHRNADACDLQVEHGGSVEALPPGDLPVIKGVLVKVFYCIMSYELFPEKSGSVGIAMAWCFAMALTSASSSLHASQDLGNCS